MIMLLKVSLTLSPTLFPPPSNVSKWRGLRGLAVLDEMSVMSGFLQRLHRLLGALDRRVGQPLRFCDARHKPLVTVPPQQPSEVVQDVDDYPP